MVRKIEGRPVAKVQKPVVETAKPAAKASLKSTGNSEFSTGKGTARKARALSVIGGQTFPSQVAGAPTVLPPTTETAAVNASIAAYDTAKNARLVADQRLAQELGLLGPTLSPDEKNAYMASFRAANAGVYEAESRAATALKATLEANVPAIEAYAQQVGADATLVRPFTEHAAFGVVAVMQGYQALAGSSEASAAVKFASDQLAQPGGVWANASAIAGRIGVPAVDLTTGILAPGVAGAVPAYMAANPDATPADAVEALRRNLGSAINLHVVGSNGATVGEMLMPLARIAGGDVSAATDLARYATSPLGAAFGAAGFTLAVVNGAASFAQGDSQGMLTSAMLATRDGAFLLNGALSSMNNAATAGVGATRFLGRLALGANAIASALDIVATLRNGNGINAGDATNLAGNALAIVASVMALSNPPVAILAAAGAIIAVAGTLISGDIERARALKASVEARMAAVGIPNPQGRFLLATQTVAREALAAVGLTVDEAAAYAQANPLLTMGLTSDITRFGAQARPLLDALAAQPGQFDTTTIQLLMGIFARGTDRAFLEQNRIGNMYDSNPLGAALAIAMQFAN